MPWIRLYCNKFSVAVISALAGQKIPDPLSGYRVISRRALEVIQPRSRDFNIDPEIVIKTARAGFKNGFIKIKCIYDNQTSHIKPIKDGYSFLRFIIKTFIQNQNKR